MIRFAVAALSMVACTVIGAVPLSAKDSLGVFSGWAAFRDAAPARCYAIAQPQRERDSEPFASVSNWPDRGVRGQLHIRMSRSVSEGAYVGLTVGSRRFVLAANGHNAWAKDARMDAAILAALRSADAMRISARGANGVRFVDRYDLAGAATAIDAAIVGCIQRNRSAANRERIPGGADRAR